MEGITACCSLALRLGRFGVGRREDRVRKPLLEIRVVLVLFEQFRIVLQNGSHDARQCLVVFDASILLV